MSLVYVLQREQSGPASTLGHVRVNGEFRCYTCEDLVRETAVVKRTDEIVTFIKDGIEVAASLSDWVATWKQPKVTAIPSGLFRLAFTFSQRFQRETIQALNVPGFTGIRVHAGNESKDTEGCVLPGLEFQGGMVLQSKPAVARWEAEAHQALKNATDVWLDVRNQA